MERGEVEELLRDGLRRLIEENYELFVGDANERSITTQLAANLRDDRRIPGGINVDHEYDRMGTRYQKILQDWIDGELKLDDKRNPVERKRSPDLLVHGHAHSVTQADTNGNQCGSFRSCLPPRSRLDVLAL